MAHFIEAEPDVWAAVKAAPRDGPVVMLNLLRFDAANDGAARYARYVQAVAPLLLEHGAELEYAGEDCASVIGDEPWDLLLLVRYPSKQAFFDMVESEAYQAIAGLRSGALVDSRLVMTTPRDGA